jgi:hypothetical protein
MGLTTRVSIDFKMMVRVLFHSKLSDKQRTPGRIPVLFRELSYVLADTLWHDDMTNAST